jgi:hypothetical protein
MIAIDTLWLTLAVSLAVQAVFFAFAAAFKTDRVTDLSYSLTFIVLASFLLWQSDWAKDLAAGPSRRPAG